MAEEVKQRLRVAVFRGFEGRMAAGGGAPENENPDDAAAENSGTGAEVTWPCICHEGSP